MSSVVPSDSDTSNDLTGLEDVEASDLVMPRLTIDHDTGEFVDSLSGERYETVSGIVLGLTKQRVLWPPEMGDTNDPPLCRSYDFQSGHPGEQFPWEAAGFDPNDTDDETLPCTACALKEWGSHPNRDIQWCAEQHVYPIVMDGGPVLFTVQRSGIKSSRSYLSSFARNRTPLYTAQTTLKLSGNRRGKVSYYVPMFTKGEASDHERWPEYASMYRSIRAFLQTPRTPDGEGPATSSRTSTSSSSTSVDETPSADGGDRGLADDDDLPF